MTDVPTLTTFLFADVENSTALWRANPARMGANLDRYDRVLRDAVETLRRSFLLPTGDKRRVHEDRGGRDEAPTRISHHTESG